VITKRACCKTQVLQQASICVLRQFQGVFRTVKNGFQIILGIAKLTGRFLTVWVWKTFLFYLLRNFFLGIMGFQPSFLLLHPPLLQVEAQCKE